MSKTKISKNNFLRQIINNDLVLGKYTSVHTRFPPEPNGYLHIGHAKSIFINFGIAQDYKGKCNLRFDDTNPVKENKKYVKAIKHDVKWLGFNWSGKIHYSSDYFDELYNYALELIKKGLAYVDELSKEQIRKYRGTLIHTGKDSPYRNRSIEDNIMMFTKMRKGMIAEGHACLRAKIDMKSPFMVMRDPVLYRIKFSYHHKTGKKWCIYPMYDFTHCISDALEGITHSLCTLEFQDNRRLYNWILENISINVQQYPHQYEFSRLNLEFTILSKRKLKKLVANKIVEDWDDPRMPTISGLRRRGYTATSIKEFCRRIGVTKQDNNVVEITALEACIRDDLNERVPRVMAVIDPVMIIIKNLPIGYKEDIIMPNHPNNPNMGTRNVIFSRKIYIERTDFREDAIKSYKRLVLGKEVRLRYAYVIKAEYIEKDKKGKIKVIYCNYNPQSKNLFKNNYGVIHWVSATNSIAAEFRIYNRLFNNPNPDREKNFLSSLNKQSLLIHNGFIELSILAAKSGDSFQFERLGYFCADSHLFSHKRPIFNRIVELREKVKVSS